MTRALLLLALLLSTTGLSAINPITDNFLDRLPKRSERIDGYSHETAEHYLSTSPVHRIEGIWQFTASGISVVIERYISDKIPSDATCYRMVLLRAPDRSIIPGSIMGYLSPTAKRDVYDSRIYTNFDGSIFMSAKRFTITMTDDERLTFKPEKKGIKFNFYRLLPRTFRIGISGQDTRDATLDGCIRIFPEPVNGPLEPRYL